MTIQLFTLAPIREYALRSMGTPVKKISIAEAFAPNKGWQKVESTPMYNATELRWYDGHGYTNLNFKLEFEDGFVAHADFTVNELKLS